jgi:hypothetical protein
MPALDLISNAISHCAMNNHENALILLRTFISVSYWAADYYGNLGQLARGDIERSYPISRIYRYELP